jgi:hypothetical protein
MPRSALRVADAGVRALLVVRIIEPASKLDILVEPVHVVVPTFG